MHQRRKEWKKDQERRIARTLGRQIEWRPITYPHLSKTFTSAGMIYPEQDNPRSTLLIIERGLQNVSINVIDKEAGASKDVSRIRPCPPGFMLNNWIAEELLVVYKPSE